MPALRPLVGLTAVAAFLSNPTVLAADSDGRAVEASSGTVSLPRFPSVSPDGSQVVFSWGGDLWKVETSGGAAMRLTSHPADESRSVWSPDGTEIAFVSNRDGYGNVWRMNADGTDIRRVTDGDRSLALADWGVYDGEERIMVSAVLEADVYREARPYMVSPDGGPIVRVHDAFGSHPVASPDGDRVLFARGGYYDGWERRHYRGAENQDVWLQQTDGSFERLTEWDGNDGKARWLDDDTVMYLSDRADRVVALYRRDVDSGENRAVRVADFDDRDIHDWSLSADGSTAVLMSWDALYRVDPRRRNAQPERIEITANMDARDGETFIDIGRNVSDAALSPDGSMMAMIAYGEIWVRPTADGGIARRVTHSHARERGVAWSPDGLKLYFSSDRDGTESIYAATVARTRDEIKNAFADATGIDTDFEPTGESDADTAAEDAEATESTPEADETDATPTIDGTWSGIVAIPGTGDVAFTMILESGPDGLVSGSIDADGASGSITGTFNDRTGAVSLSISIDGQPGVTMTGTISGNMLSATADMAGAALDVTATREPAAAPAAPAGDDDADDEPAATDDGADADDPAMDVKRWRDAMEFTIEPVVARLSNDRDARPSPDGRHLLFRGIRGNLHRLDLETNEIHDVLEHWDARAEAAWSPCSRFLAIAVSDLDFNRDIWITAVDGSMELINVTRHPDNDGSPSWSADGRLLAFVSERVNEENDVWLVALDEDFEALQGPDLDAYWERSKKAAKAIKPLKPGTFGDAPKTDAPFDADELETAYLRLRRITRLEGSEGQPRIIPSGERIVFSASGLAAGLHSVKWDGSDRKSLGGGGRVAGMDLTGSKVVLVSGGQASTVSPTGGSRKTYGFRDRIRIDLAQQSSQKFMEASRGLGEGFYHPTMHNTNWSKLTREWHELALGARTADEFNWVANRFIGELNASHMGIRAPSDVSAPLRESRGRLGTTVEAVEGGFRVTAIMEGSPADKGPMALRIGDVITSIDGEPFGPGDTVESRLRGRTGEETLIGVRRTLEDRAAMVDTEILMTPVSFGAIRGLGYQAWVKQQKEWVHEWSGGRLGYIHIQGMNQPSLDVFERDLFAAAEGRDGLVLDVRNNGGGWTTDRVLSSIMVRSHSYTVPRGAEWRVKGHYPQDRLFIQRYLMPMNLLCNEKSYSNAEIISHAFRTLERGTLVGQTTHGSVISTGGFSLIDGTSVRLPFRGWFVDDGTDRDMELNGAIPNLLVPQTPEAESEGDDEQLRAAVEDLMKRLD